MLLFFLCIVIVFILIFLAIRFSSIRFTVINLDINTTEKEIINDYQFEFGIYLFNKVKIFKYKIIVWQSQMEMYPSGEGDCLLNS